MMNGNGHATAAAAQRSDWSRRQNSMKLSQMGVSVCEDDDFCSFNGTDVAEVKRKAEHRWEWQRYGAGGGGGRSVR